MKSLLIAIPLLISASAFGGFQLQLGPDKPARLYMQWYFTIDYGSSHAVFSSGAWVNTFDWQAGAGTIWFDGVGGGSGRGFDVEYGNTDGNGGWEHAWQNWVGLWPGTQWPEIVAADILSTYFIEGEGWGYPYDCSTSQSTAQGKPTLVKEHCKVSCKVGWRSNWPYWWLGSWFPCAPENMGRYNRVADAVMMLETGGRAFPKRNSLFCLNGEAWRMRDLFAYPHLNQYDEVEWTSNIQPVKQSIPMQDVEVDGEPLGSDGKVWKAYADGTPHVVTPKVKKRNFYTFEIDQQKYSLQVKALTMGGEGSHTVLNDDGTSQQVNCLLDDNGNIYPPTYPVLYESVRSFGRSTIMEANVTFKVNSTGNEPIVFRGVASGCGYPCTFWLTNTPASYNGFWTGTMIANNPIPPSKVDYYNPLTIEWKIYSPDLSVHADLETTECPVYVSLQPPKPGTPLYHTVAHLACSQGHATTESQAVADTWGQFTGLGVTAWDGQTKLFYYYNPQDAASANVPTLSELLGPSPTPALIGHNGDCYAWAELLQASLNVNGVGASVQRVSKGAEIMVKNCGFITNAQGSLVLPPNVYDYCPPPDGIKGQNSAPSLNPSLKRFNEHRIVKLPTSCALNGGAIYLDPSYGVSAIDALDYTHQAIEGWTFGNNIWIRASDDSTASVDLP